MARVDPVPAPPNLLSLADNPKLPALVEKLPLPVLSRLIGARTRHIQGVEDLALAERFLARLPEHVKL